MATKYIGPPYQGFKMFQLPGEGVWTAVRVSPSTGQIVLQSGAQTVMGQPEGVWSTAGLKGTINLDTDGIYTLSAIVNVGPVTMLRRAAYTMHTKINLVLDERDGDPRVFHASGNTVGVNYGTANLVVSKSLKKGSHEVKLEVETYMDYSGVPSPAPYAEIIATFSSLVVALPVGATSLAKPSVEEELQQRQPTGKRKLVTREISDIEAVSPGFIELK
jgi:hypothetical protein